MRVIVIGMNPSSSQKLTKTSALSRLREWMTSIGVNDYAFANVVLTPGRVAKNMVDTDRVLSYSTQYDKIIGLGNFVSEILTDLGIDHCKLPHPSGLNRMINDPELIRKKLEDCQEYLAK